MIKFTEKEIFSTEGLYVNRIGTSIYFKRANRLPSDMEQMFKEVKTLPVNELDAAKASKIFEIENYDTSKAVNEFTYQGQSMWLTREDRLALTDRFSRELAKGVKTTNLFYSGVAIAITPQEGLDLVGAVAAYADECFDNTQKNIGKVMAAKSIDEVEAIDITEGYPEKLKLVKP